jgi:PAS domain S-box-containing protein
MSTSEIETFPDSDLLAQRTSGEKEDFLIVGLGASAGGIQALREFFENVPTDSGIAYVVILHISPDHDSQLAGVLQQHCKLPVAQVTEKVRVQPDHVYVVPPNQHLEMHDGHITVSQNLLVEERRAPVDIFFRTLAESHQSRAVGVILSGTGANGSMGIKRIKERGGAAFVQNPREAEFNEMPRNSIATGLIDGVLPVAQIPARIITYKESLGKIEIPVEPEERPEDQQQALREVFTLLRVHTGHDFSNYKRPTLLRRIERRINIHNLPSLPAYAAFMAQNTEETHALLKDLLISVTNFFRDRRAFEAVEQEILPRLFAEKNAGEPLRIWCVGCATGEEAYSLAMLCAERTLGVIDGPKIQIFATDIDQNAINIARDGLYTLNDAADVSPERLRRFFTKEGDEYRVRREIREMILFAVHNALKAPPFSRIDLATCRNMMIYLNPAAQERILETLHFALRPGGFLFLGSSESVDGASDLYAIQSREHHLYQSREIAPRAYPVPESIPTFQYEPLRPEPSPQGGSTPARGRMTYGDLHAQLLEQYAPPSIVVNEEYDIVHLSERAGRYLQVAGGEPSNNLLKLVRPELSLELRSALYQATQRKSNVEARGLPVRIEDKTEAVNIHVRPVLREGDTARGFILVLFEQAEPGAARDEEVLISSEEPVARQLEEELTRLKAQLRNSVEQHEFQAEELKASNEELQSINEELTTVNQELKVKVEETAIAGNNLQNLINSTDLGTIFLDRSFRVNLFTPAAREIFNLIPADYGRPISDITHRLEYSDLIADCETVLDKLHTVEHEVSTQDGRAFLMRVLPYRTGDDRIQGVVVTFTDISSRKQAEENLRASEEQLRAYVDATSGTIYEMSADWSEIRPFTGKNFVASTSETMTDWLQNCVPADEQARVRAEIENAVENKRPFEMEHRIIHLDGSIGWTFLRAVPIFNAQGEIERWFGAASDITDRKQAAEDLRNSEEQFRRAIEDAPIPVIMHAEDGEVLQVSRSWSELTGYTLEDQDVIHSWLTKAYGYGEEEFVGQNAAMIFTPEDRAKGEPEKEIETARREGRALDERWHLRKNGERFFANGVLTALRDERGHLTGFAKIMRDMTDRKRMEEELQAAHDELEARVQERTLELALINANLESQAQELRRSEGERRLLLQRIVSAQEEERHRISRELHDQMGQQLTALLLDLKSLPAARAQTQTALVEDLMTRVHHLAWEMRPAALDNIGLKAALAQYVKEWSRQNQIVADFLSRNFEDEARLPEQLETTFYRVAQEALVNVQRHAKASDVSVVLERDKETVTLIIEDNGCGFAVEDEPRSRRAGRLGILGMRERLELIGGSLTIESSPDNGTSVYVRATAQGEVAGSAAGTKG